MLTTDDASIASCSAVNITGHEPLRLDIPPRPAPGIHQVFHEAYTFTKGNVQCILMMHITSKVVTCPALHAPSSDELGSASTAATLWIQGEQKKSKGYTHTHKSNTADWADEHTLQARGAGQRCGQGKGGVGYLASASHPCYKYPGLAGRSQGLAATLPDLVLHRPIIVSCPCQHAYLQPGFTALLLRQFNLLAKSHAVIGSLVYSHARQL